MPEHPPPQKKPEDEKSSSSAMLDAFARAEKEKREKFTPRPAESAVKNAIPKELAEIYGNNKVPSEVSKVFAKLKGKEKRDSYVAMLAAEEAKRREKNDQKNRRNERPYKGKGNPWGIYGDRRKIIDKEFKELYSNSQEIPPDVLDTYLALRDKQLESFKSGKKREQEAVANELESFIARQHVDAKILPTEVGKHVTQEVPAGVAGEAEPDGRKEPTIAIEPEPQEEAQPEPSIFHSNQEHRDIEGTRQEWKDRLNDLIRQVTEKRESLLTTEKELMAEDVSFYKEHGALGRFARKIVGKDKNRASLEGKTNEAAAEYARALEAKLAVRLAEKTKKKNLSKDEATRLAERYRRMVVWRDIVGRSEQGRSQTREKTLASKEKSSGERALKWLAERNAELDKKLGKTGARVARVFLSATAGSLVVAALGPASVVALGSVWTARAARGLAGTFGGAAIGGIAGKLYEKTGGARAAKRLAESKVVAAGSSEDIATNRTAYRKGSSEAIEHKRRIVEAVSALVSGAGTSLATAYELAGSEATHTAVDQAAKQVALSETSTARPVATGKIDNAIPAEIPRPAPETPAPAVKEEGVLGSAIEERIEVQKTESSQIDNTPDTAETPPEPGATIGFQMSAASAEAPTAMAQPEVAAPSAPDVGVIPPPEKVISEPTSESPPPRGPVTAAPSGEGSVLPEAGGAPSEPLIEVKNEPEPKFAQVSVDDSGNASIDGVPESQGAPAELSAEASPSAAPEPPPATEPAKPALMERPTPSAQPVSSPVEPPSVRIDTTVLDYPARSGEPLIVEHTDNVSAEAYQKAFPNDASVVQDKWENAVHDRFGNPVHSGFESPPAGANHFGVVVPETEAHVYAGSGGKEVFVYGGSPTERAKSILEYLVTKDPKGIVYAASDDGKYRIPWRLVEGKLVPGTPVRTGGILNFFSSWMKPPSPDDFAKIIK